MSDGEQKDRTTEEPREAAAEDSTAGPAAEQESPAPPPETPDSAPPAEEEPEAATEEAAAAEEPAPAAEAEAAPAAEPNPEDELPWKERRRLERSRRPHEPGPALSPEQRKARRAEARRAKSALRRKQRAATSAKRGGSGTGTPAAERRSNAPKVRQGVVVSNKAEKSITVRIDIVRRHPVYEKVVHRSRTLHAHDERNEANEGDIVRVVETRPLSKSKRWRLVDIVEKAR
jgi:small subunit ribosomal protein S17